MDFRDGLSAELPAPRDDEPGGLRDDILDELADHLACAYRRELLRGADTATARQRVLERFGDPAALVRRLWFDAMKGKIMAQRILVVCCILLTVISLSLAVRDVEPGSSRPEARRDGQRSDGGSDAARSIAPAANARAVAGDVEGQRPHPGLPTGFPSRSSSTQETPDGPPAVGVQCQPWSRHPSVNSGSDAIDRESDDKGAIDFGVVQPGDWEFTLYSDAWSSRGTLNVLPGTTIEKTSSVPEFRSSSSRSLSTSTGHPISRNGVWPPTGRRPGGRTQARPVVAGYLSTPETRSRLDLGKSSPRVPTTNGASWWLLSCPVP